MYVRTVGPADARIFFVGEAPGKDEETTGLPFQGYAGKTFNWLIAQAGINRSECLIGNVARVRPPDNKINYYFEDKKCTIPKPILAGWIKELKSEIELYKPNIIVALGSTALWALTGQKAISKFRGYVIPCTLVLGYKVLPCYHPQNINYEWKNFYPTIMDLRKAKYHSRFPEIPDESRMLIDKATFHQFRNYCLEILSDDSTQYSSISVDIETIQPGSHIGTIGISHSPKFAMSINILNGRTPALSLQEETELWTLLGEILTTRRIIMQNAPFDVGVIYLNHHILVDTTKLFDTLIAAHVCWPELPRDLGFITSICADVRPWKHTAEENKSLYNAEDCANTFADAVYLSKEMATQDVTHTFNFEMSQIPVALMMQLQGIPLDLQKRDEILAVCFQKMEENQTAVNTFLNKKVSCASPAQIKQVLYYDLGLPPQFKRRKKATDPRVLTTDAKALKRLSRLVPDNPIFNHILEYKKYAKLATFLGFSKKYNKVLPDFFSKDNRAHTCYNITGKKSDGKKVGMEDDEGAKSFGRWSSSKSIILPFGSGNLQNIPPEARKIYRAPAGYTLLQADLVQAEAVDVAYRIGDQKLISLFEERFKALPAEKGKYDIHKVTASEMFAVPLEQVTKEQRRIGKTLRHAGNYGAGPNVIADALGCDLSTAKRLSDLYHRVNPLLHVWHKRLQEQLRTEGMTLVNAHGRKHRFLGRWDDNLFRSANSFCPQSDVGDLLNSGLVKFYDKYGSEVDIWLQLHDAIYICIPKGTEQLWMSRIRECLVQEMVINRRSFYIDVDFKAGDSWGEQEDLTEVWEDGYWDSLKKTWIAR